ncbi:RING finger protein 10-like [Homalodisca vitripennis]|nr:RING finger protein 10-like [Homalodisca vitripennis]XP_046685567.1 RING finger protein 10-like [Homalodisca vitripennis]
MDKRPRPRGQLYGGGKESAQVEECEAELGSLYSTGSKKQNLNHLLNFHYAPRGETARPSPRPSHQYGVRWLMSTQKHKYNKEHFLQANCQFVVRANADYTPYLADPDHLVDWDFIEQIRVPSVEPVHCPICLSTPVAAKMTRCGHIYCYPCILHYLALSDKTWHKCPICFEAIHKQHLKSVKVDGKRGYSVGQLITFQLMVRERGSLMVCPVSQLEVRTQHKPVLAVSETQLDTAFAKLLIADRAEVLAMIEQEVKELKVEKSENEGCPELCFVEQALELCEERRLNIDQKIKEIVEEKPMEEVTENEEATNANVLSSSPDESAIVYESAFDNIPVDNINSEDKGETVSTNNNRTRYESLSSEGEDPSLTAITPEDLEVFHAHQPPTQSKNFYFYQACDGQQIYLHAVNVQMLEMTYGSLRESPATLTGVIVEKEAGSMTVELRRRLRYLQHLPVTAQFEVAEIELRPPVITEETFSAFADQLEQRRKRRQKRAREERRREKKIAEVELRQMGRHRTPRLRLDSHHHFPQCGIAEDELPPPPPRAPSAESSRASSPSSRRSVSPNMAALTLDQDSSPSFAQMLRGNPNVKPQGWGWPRVSEASKPRAPSPPRRVDSDGESAPPPHYNLSFCDVITAAMQKASISQDQTDTQGGKKKKKKQKLLFSTGMACTSK